MQDFSSKAREYSFWPPYYIWLKGELFDTHHLPVEDSDGNTVGILF